jgi:Marseilleviridae restriction endonuclease
MDNFKNAIKIILDIKYSQYIKKNKSSCKYKNCDIRSNFGFIHKIYCDNHKLNNMIQIDISKIYFHESFAFHEKSQYWSNKNLIRPKDIKNLSCKKFIFNCKICNHEFDNSPNNITSKNRWCIYCVNQKLCNNNNCIICFNKSFANHKKSQYWSNKNIITTRNVFKFTAKKYWFDCNICNHEFKSSINNITNNNTWCPYCVNRKLCDDINCNNCYEKSFANYKKSKYWSTKNLITPRNVFKSSHVKYWFICKNNHKFDSALNHITNHNSWCPKCVYKTEGKLLNWLKFNFSNYEIITQFKLYYDNKYFKYDFMIKELNLIIELDGNQHFKQISNWTTPEYNLKNDINKIKLAITNNYKIIHILQENVLYDKNNWNNKLLKVINIHLLKYDIIFINNKNKYKNHILTIKNNIY